MKDRINDKINEIEGFLENLDEFKLETLEEYKKNILRKSACERIIEKIIEALVDLAFLTIRYIKEEIPENTNDTEIFEILYKKNIITEALCKKMKEAKGMRNWLAHEYGKIDDEIIYNAIEDELSKDVNEFIASISKLMDGKIK